MVFFFFLTLVLFLFCNVPLVQSALLCLEGIKIQQRERKKTQQNVHSFSQSLQRSNPQGHNYIKHQKT